MLSTAKLIRIFNKTFNVTNSCKNATKSFLQDKFVETYKEYHSNIKLNDKSKANNRRKITEFPN